MYPIPIYQGLKIFFDILKINKKFNLFIIYFMMILINKYILKI